MLEPRPQEREVLVCVIANGVIVIFAGYQPAVAFASIVLIPTGLVVMSRIRMAASLVIIGAEAVCREAHSHFVHVAQPSLSPICAREPAEEMIERTILHHRDHDMFDPGFVRLRQ